MTKNTTNTLRALLFAAVFALLAAMTGCAPLVPESAEEVTVYATFYPIYALTDAVTAGVPNLSLHCLIQPQDDCLRAYQLSDWDRRLLSTARAVIMGGRGLESFESIVFGYGNDGPAVSAVLYSLELYNASTSHDGESAESHLNGPNPHLYMSVEGAKRIVESIAASMLELDPDYADLYAQNAEQTAERLDGLRAEMQAAVGDIAGTPVILMNEALIYVARDFGLTVADRYDREPGTSLYDVELSKCLARLRSTEARVVLVEKQAPQNLVKALKDAGFSVARLDILSTRRESEGFEGYLQAQRENAAALRAALIARSGQEETP